MKTLNEILASLKGEAVRLTIETNTLDNATLTYSDFTSLEDVMDGDVIKGQVMFFDGVNTMGRTNQKLVKILKIEVFNNEWIEKFVAEPVIEVADVEYNDGLNGYIVELKDGRIVQVQFERETNRLHADYNTYFAFIDKENDYGLDLSDEEEELFYEWMSNNKDIQDKIKELDAEAI